MKILAVTLLFNIAALPLCAATQVTVAELERTVTSAHSTPDAKLADELSSLELTQRISSSTLVRLQSGLPGPKSREELAILADESSFLDLPPADIPPNPAPNVAEQRKIMSLVVNYVTQTIHQLPNFLATRETRSFQDRPAGTYSYLPLHQTNQFVATVLYRDGKEVDRTVVGKKAPAPDGLVSWGEFGPILTTILLDAARSRLSWSHWEHGSSTSLAVFHYSVPSKNSQYQVQMCGSNPCAQALTGYHGEIAADPASGAILRATVIADLDTGTDLEHSTGLVTGSITVEYGTIEIGGKPYICPVHSIALAQVRQRQPQHGVISAEGLDHSPRQTMLNAVNFTNYHIFRGESRILTDAEAAQMTGQPDDSASTTEPTTPAEPEQPSTTTSETAIVPTASPSNTTMTSSPSAEPKSPPPAPGTPAAPIPPADASSTSPEFAAVQPPSAAPAAIADMAQPSPAPDIPDTPVLRTTTHQVLVDVIVSAHNGDPVARIPQSNFSITEDGKPQTIDFFEEHSAQAAAKVDSPVMPPMPAGTVTNVPVAPPSSALYVFLLDSLNSEPQDQVYIHKQILTFLHRLDPGTQVAIFTLGTNLHLLQGFTSDPATLLAAVSGKGAEREAMAQNRSDNADDAATVANFQKMRATPEKIEALQAAQSSARNYGFGARASMTFEALNALARYLEGIPGRKNLVWFSSSFPVVLFPTASEMAQLKNNPNLPGAVDRIKQTANLFTLSKIAVYPVSGAGVMNSNVGLADSADAGSAGGTGHFGASANPTSSLTGEALNSGSAISSMEQLAASTGGRAFATNDIGSALTRIVHDSDVYYTVGYAPADSTAPEGFRRINVKVAGGKYKLDYRQGYNASNADTNSGENPITPLLQLGLPAATGIFYGAGIASVSTPARAEPAGQNPDLKGPLTRYAASFTIRAQDISFSQARSGKRIAKLLIGIKAYAEDGSALNWLATREAIELDAAHYESLLKSGIPITLNIDLPANAKARFVTAVYDWNTTRAGTLEIQLHQQ
jgi:VWFA-related protein